MQLVTWRVALLALAFVLASAGIASYGGRGLVYDQAHQHEGSAAYSDNGSDYSTMHGSAGTPDNILSVYDQTCNGYDARGRAWDQGVFLGAVRDDNGCGVGGASIPLGRNASSHDTCTGLRDGVLFGCGPNSGHGT